MNTEIKCLPSNAICKLNQFTGYGNLKGKIWFVGLEEGLNKRLPPESIYDHLLIRLNFDTVEDLQCATIKLNETRFHSSSKPRLQSTWRWMAKIMVGLAGKDWEDEELLFAYQSKCLGQKNDKAFLAELYPLPKPNFNAWPEIYNKFFGFKNAAEYRAAFRDQRVKWMKNLIIEHEPPVVICYGKGRNWDEFRNFFDCITFNCHAENSSWLKGNHPKTKTTIILAPHFSWFSRSGQNQCRGTQFCKELIEFLNKTVIV